MEDISYVSLLENYLKSDNLKPTYQMVAEDNNASRRSVSIQLIVNAHTVTGNGRTKKEAKEHAAEVMYNLLIDEERRKVQQESGDNKDSVESLMDLCSKLSLGSPTFKYELSNVSSHSKIYTISCNVSGITETVKSFRKDKGKKQVANIMLSKLKEQAVVYDDFLKLKDEEMKKKNATRLPDGSMNAEVERQLFVEIRNKQFVECIKKSSTAYSMKLKAESDIDELKDPEGVFQKIMKEMEVDYRIVFRCENHEWVCSIEMLPISFKMKMKHKNKSKAGKLAIINTLKYIHQKYEL